MKLYRGLTQMSNKERLVAGQTEMALLAISSEASRQS